MMPLVRLEECRPSVARLVLCRPEKRNALGADLLRATLQAIDAIDASGASVGILASEGDVFCAGADLAGLGGDGPTMVDLCERLLTSSAFWIAAVQGPALGAGVALLAVCPMSVVSRQAWFALPEVSLGLFPAGVAAYLEPTLGTRHCVEWGLRGSRIPAAAPEVRNLVTELVDPGDLEGRVMEWAVKLADMQAPTQTARLVWQGALLTHGVRERRQELVALLSSHRSA
jgi:enoyl-CoA hydratase/carnithine racemase